LREAQKDRGAQGIEAEILADFASQNPLDWSEKPGLEFPAGGGKFRTAP
jgi:hypothetical protein